MLRMSGKHVIVGPARQLTCLSYDACEHEQKRSRSVCPLYFLVVMLLPSVANAAVCVRTLYSIQLLES